MIDQSFSRKNIEEIFDAENKRGVNIERMFEGAFRESIALTADLKSIRKQIKFTHDLETRKSLIDDLNNQTETRKEILTDIFENISNHLKGYNPEVIHKLIDSKSCYTLSPTVESFFYSKIIQKNLRDTYKIKQLSRYHILKSVIHFVSDKFPKVIIRTDIKNFYESIPQEDIINQLSNDHLVTVNTKRCILNILESFNSLTGNTVKKGLPRGIGISAYLSEIYMRQIDKQINKIEDLVYFARYVDDIIVIFVPSQKNLYTAEDYINEIKNIIQIESNGALVINEEKTNDFDLQSDSKEIVIIKNEFNSASYSIKDIKYDKGIQYLGYFIGLKETKIIRDGTTKLSYEIAVDISDKKVKDYKTKIKLSFEYFIRKKKHNPKYAFELLRSRLIYLMTNTQLSNNKSNVFVGLYYSYPFITENLNLKKLDRSLVYYTGRSRLSFDEKLKLKNLSFAEYYSKKEFMKHCLSNKKYKNYNAVDSNSINLENNGVLKFGIREITSIWKK
ncbi:antiviral reverse transcriptase Drt3a [Parapedobacter tibetensis]|uniref:antiviral reverse transcriptase Drt3a n=1 Tax=Parapedobacter tibetensis TaxID=2972951 RepID=UPI00214D71D3|nr:antiviral reverse transcriptase Drt3a [Parapedobacter tibetensis]